MARVVAVERTARRELVPDLLKFREEAWLQSSSISRVDLPARRRFTIASIIEPANPSDEIPK
jgi:hypothetical protein